MQRPRLLVYEENPAVGLPMCHERATERVGHTTRARLPAQAPRGTGSPRRRGGGRGARRAEYLAWRPRPRRLEQPSRRHRLDQRSRARARGKAAPHAPPDASPRARNAGRGAAPSDPLARTRTRAKRPPLAVNIAIGAWSRAGNAFTSRTRTRAHERQLLGGGHPPWMIDVGPDPGGQPPQQWPIERRPFARPAPSSATSTAAEASSTSSAATTPSPRSTPDSRSSPAPATRRERQRRNVERGTPRQQGTRHGALDR